MKTFSALLAICAGNSPVPGEFPTQRPVTRSFDVYFDLHPNKRLSKQSWGWWFGTLSLHYDVIVMYAIWWHTHGLILAPVIPWCPTAPKRHLKQCWLIIIINMFIGCVGTHLRQYHCSDVIMGAIASQITSFTIVYPTVYSGADQMKHQSSASLFLWGEFIGDRWIPRTKGEWRGKCFHVMMSSRSQQVSSVSILNV